MKSQYVKGKTVRQVLIDSVVSQMIDDPKPPTTHGEMVQYMIWNSRVGRYRFEQKPYVEGLSTRGLDMLMGAIKREYWKRQHEEAERMKQVEADMRQEAIAQMVAKQAALEGVPPFAITRIGEYYAQQFYGLVEMMTESGTQAEPCWMAAHKDTRGNWTPKFFVAPTDKECEDRLKFAPLLINCAGDTAEDALAYLAKHLDELFEVEEEKQFEWPHWGQE